MSYDAVLLIAFGGPEKMADVRPFLANVTKGRPIPPHRLEAVVRHYELFDGRSPLNAITFRQAKALQTLLQQEGCSLPVYVGMRNWPPYLPETLEQMAVSGIQRALGFILSAQQSEAGWDRYQQNVAEARAQVGPHAPTVDYVPGWHKHPLFIEAVADLTRVALEQIPPERRSETPLVFTAHSVPTAMPSTPTYVQQIEEGARLVSEKLGRGELVCRISESQWRSSDAVAGAGYWCGLTKSCRRRSAQRGCVADRICVRSHRSLVRFGYRGQAHCD